MAKTGLRMNVKFRRLVAMLGIPEAHAVGHLECLWHTVYETGQEVIGDEQDVEMAAGWVGEPGALAKALFECGGMHRSGFLDKNEAGAFTVHDLYDHAPKYVMDRKRQAVHRAKTRGSAKKAENVTPVSRDVTTCHTTPCDNGVTVTHVSHDVTQVSRDVTPPHGFVAHSPTQPNLPKYSPDDLKVAEEIFALIRKMNPKHKEQNLKKWAGTIRLMRERDGRTHEEIRKVFEWANSDSFWRVNVLCPETLRKQWDKLTVRMQNPPTPPRKPAFSKDDDEAELRRLGGES